ncbi:MAG: metallophosphoesterase family protein [Phycisphaerales bacterium]|nr:metallophosphoesterase family protein [Phycisphaerales bacterium]
MPTAVLSDIHANAEALRTVLADIDSRGIDRIICAGDIIGYGPDPLECVDLIAQRCEWSLMGNHDFAILYEPTNFNPGAEQAAFWTRAQFENEPDEALRAKRWEFLGHLRVRTIDQEKFLAVHGSPRRPINEYIFPDDMVSSPAKMQQIFERIDQYCLVGHTHVPGVFVEGEGFISPLDLRDASYPLTNGQKAIINVGSVGQPRDQDPRSSFVILHDDRAEFVRVPYDVDVTVDRIREIPELTDWLGDRLYEGR